MSDAFSFDVVIVGGGLAGGLAAVTLAKAGFSCAVVDTQDPAAMRTDTFDGRTTAISYASARLFRRVGIWQAFQDRAGPIHDILVTDGRAKGRFRDGHVSPFNLHFDSRELEPETPLGWIVENVALRNAIYDAIETNDNIKLFAPARRTGAEYGKASAIIPLEDGRKLTAPLVIAADGKGSALRGEAGVKVNRWTYGQTGIVATVAHEEPHKGVAQEFFLPGGPFAILPMTPVGEGQQDKLYRSSLVWTEDQEAAPAYMKLDDARFIDEINRRFGPYLGEVSLAGPRFSYPLSFHLSQSFIAPRLALIGDAARAIHPIAGQGFNLGVKDIAALADVTAEARDVGLDIGAISVLDNYQRWRRFDSTALALGTDALNRLFSNDLAPIRLARSLGMGAVNRIAPLRKTFMRQAGADLGKLPPLLQPEQ